MSGHSKWATIKRQKGANDMKRGQIFTKLSNAITVSVRQGGGVGDPESNFKLRLAVEAARAANMPKENIERAIARAAGKQDSNLEEVVYEGFGPGGFSVIVEGYTDNKQRTVAEVKNVMDKNGGSMGSQGSVMYQFVKKGLISIEKDSLSLDEIFNIAVESGAEDVEEVGDEVVIYTRPEDLAKVRAFLLEKQIIIKNAELMYKPTNLIDLPDVLQAEKAISFLEKLEDLGDIQKVYANFDIPDGIIK